MPYSDVVMHKERLRHDKVNVEDTFEKLIAFIKWRQKHDTIHVTNYWMLEALLKLWHSVA